VRVTLPVVNEQIDGGMHSDGISSNSPLEPWRVDLHSARGRIEPMEKSFHRFSELFAQLGLPAEVDFIREFVDRHSPMHSDVRRRGRGLLDGGAGPVAAGPRCRGR
jgi:hypothetical protein